jgi:hypothetical protein
MHFYQVDENGVLLSSLKLTQAYAFGLITKHHSHQTDKNPYQLRVPSDNGFISTVCKSLKKKRRKLAFRLLLFPVVSLDSSSPMLLSVSTNGVISL